MLLLAIPQQRMCQRIVLNWIGSTKNVMLYPVPKAKISVHNFVNHELVSVDDRLQNQDKFHKRDICNPFVISTAKEFVK